MCNGKWDEGWSGTRAFALSSSMANCTAARASLRCVLEMAISTLDSAVGTTPMRCATATCRSFQRWRAFSMMTRISRSAIGAYASYWETRARVRNKTSVADACGRLALIHRPPQTTARTSSFITRMPSKWSRVVPMKVAMAPAVGQTTRGAR